MLSDCSNEGFVVAGCPSGGTHMVAVRLGAHSDIFVGPELWLLNHGWLYGDFGVVKRLVRDRMRRSARVRAWMEARIGGGAHAMFAREGPPSFARRLDAYGHTPSTFLRALEESESLVELVDRVMAPALIRHGARIWGEKTLHNSLVVRDLRAALKRVGVVHVVRDGRDAVLSRLRRGVPPVTAVASWAAFTASGLAVAGQPAYCRIRYEDFVTDVQAELERCCDMLSLEFEPQMLRPAQARSMSREFHGTWKSDPFGEVSSRTVGQFRRGMKPWLETLFWSCRFTDAFRREAGIHVEGVGELMAMLGYDVPGGSGRGQVEVRLGRRDRRVLESGWFAWDRIIRWT